MEAELGVALRSFLGASLTMSPEDMEVALLYPSKRFKVHVAKNNIMSVDVPKIEYEELEKPQHLSLWHGQHHRGAGCGGRPSKEALPGLIRLAELEKTCNMLADEIERRAGV